MILNKTFFLDIDECMLENHNCSPNAKCINKMGSYSCVCHDGYHGNGSICTGINVLKYLM